MDRLEVWSAETGAVEGEEEDDGQAAGGSRSSSGCCCWLAVESRRRFCVLGFTSSAIATCALTGRGSAFLLNTAPRSQQSSTGGRVPATRPSTVAAYRGSSAQVQAGEHCEHWGSLRAPFGTRSEGRAPGAKRDGSGETGTCHRFSCWRDSMAAAKQSP